MILSDSAIFVLSLIVAYYFRFEFSLSRAEIQQIQTLLLWIVPLKIALFLVLGLYRGMWRFTSIGDFWHLAQASLISMLAIMAAILYLYRFVGFSRAVFLIDGILTFIATGGIRLLIRSHYSKRPNYWSDLKQTLRNHTHRVIIIGAGSAGEKILREIFDNHRLKYDVRGFVDDDPEKQGRSMHGVPVLGFVGDLPAIIEKYEIKEVLIAIPSASGNEIRKIVSICKQCNVPHKILPGIGEIIDGRVSMKILRDVSYEDLLGRAPVQLDLPNIRSYLRDHTVMVTGCGGSIGSELCRRIIPFRPGALVLVDAGEANLFQIQMELKNEIHFHDFHPILGQTQDRHLMESVFDRYRPSVVFHAAAYKHVPMLELNPREAVLNNIMATQVLTEIAVKYKVDRFVLVSTDKAVRPTNVMGTSKRVSELILQSAQDQGTTRFVAVRFGNVVGSSGSVVPLFRRQIEQGGPVTVTHPEVTRYFMTISEAAQLIIQAGAMGQGGELFVLEMGTPIKIADMARDLIRLSGKEPDQDVQVVFTGLRGRKTI